MPEICRFLGMMVFKSDNDHLPPYFHAEHIDGALGQRAALPLNWGRAHDQVPLEAIAALD